MKTLLPVAWCLLPVLSAAGQGIELRGIVHDPDARPIPGVEVRAQEARGLTDSLGRFVLRGLSGDSVRLELRRIGYQALTRTISLREPPVGLELVLSPDPVVLPEIRTTARADKPARYLGTTKYDGFFQRQKLGLGTFISREQIERMNAFHTLEIFRGIPGIYVSVGNPGDPYSADIRLARCTGKVSVWIDGRLQIGGGFDRGNGGSPNRRALSTELAALLEQIAPAGIEMIEVYRGVSQIPGVFHWDGCAVIAIWTRYNRGADSTAGRPH
jgi:hypothetical protein